MAFAFCCYRIVTLVKSDSDVYVCVVFFHFHTVTVAKVTYNLTPDFAKILAAMFGESY